VETSKLHAWFNHAGINPMPRRKPAAPVVIVQGRISLEAEKVRRELEADLDISVSKLIELGLFALDRERKAMAHP
jgi:hypothetical protein